VINFVNSYETAPVKVFKKYSVKSANIEYKVSRFSIFNDNIENFTRFSTLYIHSVAIWLLSLYDRLIFLPR
jgi:hypothetical protein